MCKLQKIEICALACVSLALRASVSLFSYSGQHKPPMFGDYEAQRHWQEITVNLPTEEWYRNSTANNLLYWGLDYPPLTAYHSLLIGKIAHSYNDNFTKLELSRGMESESHKTFMRLSVLIADMFIYIPGVIALGLQLQKSVGLQNLLGFYVIALFYPGQILIDNGHFQYNNVSLGLTAIAISLILGKRHYLASLFYTLALNYKQMELYHALPFFSFLIGFCCSQKSFTAKIGKLSSIGAIVILTFIILWLPWIYSLDTIKNVLGRLFPFGRGVFEDKVANFWCALNVVYKLKYNLSNSKLVLVCLISTLLAAAPSNVHLLSVGNERAFLFSLTNTALAFFLFSFQVHEKSILLAALPSLCLFAFKPFHAFLFLQVTTLSMLPLLVKDELALPFFSTCVIFNIIGRKICIDHKNYEFTPKYINYLSTFTEIAISFLAVLEIGGPVPQKYPFLWPLIVSLFSCTYFIMFYIYCNLCQLVPSIK